MQDENTPAQPAEASNKDLERFLALASHELHTPLRHIKCFTELLSEHVLDALDDQSRHYLDVISNAATEMSLLIDQLLEWARISTSEMIINRVDLNLLVRSVISSFEREIGERTIEWDLGNLPVVKADLNMLRVALVCLVSNAIKATHLQPVARIWIAAEPGLTDQNDSIISIKDNGVACEIEQDDQLFGLFATVRRIVHRHGGKVWVESEKEKGNAIYLTLGSGLES